METVLHTYPFMCLYGETWSLVYYSQYYLLGTMWSDYSVLYTTLLLTDRYYSEKPKSFISGVYVTAAISPRQKQASKQTNETWQEMRILGGHFVSEENHLQ